DAGNLQLLLETFGDASHQIRNLRARRAVHRLRPVGLDPGRDVERAVLELHLDGVMHDELKLAFRPLHLDGLPFDGRSNARGDRHRLLANTGHDSILLLSIFRRSGYRLAVENASNQDLARILLAKPVAA